MAREKADRRRKGKGGWISALFWVFSLCGVGFLVGVALGLFAENPDLVVAHVRGATEEISWSKDAIPVAQGVQGSEVLAGKLVSEAPFQRVDEARPVEREAPVRGGYLVQVGAFETAKAAERQMDSLRKSGLNARVFPSTSTRSSWRVRVGPYPSRAEAQSQAKRLEAQGVSTWVLADEGEPGSL